MATISLTCMRLFLHIWDVVASTKEILWRPVSFYTSTLEMQPVFAMWALYPLVLLDVVMENTGRKQDCENFTNIPQYVHRGISI